MRGRQTYSCLVELLRLASHTHQYFRKIVLQLGILVVLQLEQALFVKRDVQHFAEHHERVVGQVIIQVDVSGDHSIESVLDFATQLLCYGLHILFVVVIVRHGYLQLVKLLDKDFILLCERLCLNNFL